MNILKRTPATSAHFLRERPNGEWEAVPLPADRCGLYDDARGDAPVVSAGPPPERDGSRRLGVLLGTGGGADRVCRDWILLIQPGAPLTINGDDTYAAVGFKELRNQDLLVIRNTQRLVFASGEEPGVVLPGEESTEATK